MAYNFSKLMFTPAMKALQEKHGSRRQYARFEDVASPDRFGPNEQRYIATRDSFYLASVAANGWPYVQHRGGPVGFLKALDPTTLAFADFRGNKQYISTGNLATDNRVAMILVDYPSQSRLKILGRAELIEPDKNPERFAELIDRVRDPETFSGYGAQVEAIMVIHVEAFDWNCQQHIIPRYTAEQVQQALHAAEQKLAPLETRIAELERENAELRAQRANG
jgi:predicted pyridoxine 5'-phosphate oxidase superfamily flavin-nucleotide-binding protein